MSVLLLVALLGCGDKDGGDSGPAGDGGAADGGAADGGAGDGGVDGGAGDGGADGGAGDGGAGDGGAGDGGAGDGGSGDGGTPLDGVRWTLTDGSVLEGQPVGTYDESLWWHPSDHTSLGLFDPTTFATWPDGRSMRFVSDAEIAKEQSITLPEDRPSYTDFLRDSGITIDAMPLDVDGPAYVIMGNSGYHLEEDGYGNYAWDLVLTDDAGARYTGFGARNEDFLVWGTDVLLPTAGTVIEVYRTAPDNDPGSYPSTSAPNNLVGIWLGGHYYLYLLHFQQGSIPASVRVGAELPAGTFLGTVGNSGVTLEPHLHMTLMYYDMDPAGKTGEVRTWSIPGEWRDLWTAESPTGPATLHEWSVPVTGQWVGGADFSKE